VAARLFDGGSERDGAFRFGGGGSFRGGGASTDRTSTISVAYDESSESLQKQDAYHRFSRTRDHDIVLGGREERGDDGYVQYEVEDWYPVKGTKRWGTFEVGGKWESLGSTPVFMVEHRFFREDKSVPRVPEER
jgi:hypothetical protein